MVKFLMFKSNCPLDSLNYVEQLNKFNLEPLNHRRFKSQCKFGFKIINNVLDCPEILSHFNFKVKTNHNTRNKDLFALNKFRTNYNKYSVVNRVQTSLNIINGFIDIQSCSFQVFVCTLNNLDPFITYT